VYLGVLFLLKVWWYSVSYGFGSCVVVFFFLVVSFFSLVIGWRMEVLLRWRCLGSLRLVMVVLFWFLL